MPERVASKYVDLSLSFLITLKEKKRLIKLDVIGIIFFYLAF